MSRNIKKLYSNVSERVKSVEYHPTEPILATSLFNGTIQIYNTNDMSVLKTICVESNKPVRCIRFMPSFHWLIASGDDLTIYCYDYNTGALVTSIPNAHNDFIRKIAVHPTQPLFLSCSDDCKVKLFRVKINEISLERTFEGHKHYVMDVKINPKDPSTFATASVDNTINFWSLAESQKRFSLEGHREPVNCIEFFTGNDRHFIASGSDDRTIKIWDYQTLSCVITLSGHSENLSALRIHPIYPLLFSTAEDNMLFVWNTLTYEKEDALDLNKKRGWAIDIKDNQVAVGYDEGLVILKIGDDIDSNRQTFVNKNNEVQSTNLHPDDKQKQSQTKEGALFTFDPFEKEREEAKNTNYFFGEDDEEYLKVIKKIGEGATSITYKVFDSRTQRMMCKKVLKIEAGKTTFKRLQDAMKEFEILHSIFHPCICRAIALDTREPIDNNGKEEEENDDSDSDGEKKVNTTLAIYLEFLNNGLKENLSKKLMDNTLKTRIVIEIVHAMKYIHKLGLIHRDLKIENIMMNSVFEAKIVDFGLAKIDECINQSDFNQSFTKGVGTLAYMSPEMLNEKDYDYKTDVYSFGIVLYCIFTGNLPKYNMEDKINKKPLPFPKPSFSASQFCFDLIAKCCKYDPSERPSFEEILDEIRKNNYLLASDIDLSIVSKRDKELDFFEMTYKNNE